MVKYVITSTEFPDRPVSVSENTEEVAAVTKAYHIAKTIFCDKCNIQRPGSTITFSKLHEDCAEFIAVVDFKAPRFSTEHFYQMPAIQQVKINHKLWRLG